MLFAHTFYEIHPPDRYEGLKYPRGTSVGSVAVAVVKEVEHAGEESFPLFTFPLNRSAGQCALAKKTLCFLAPFLMIQVVSTHVTGRSQYFPVTRRN